MKKGHGIFAALFLALLLVFSGWNLLEYGADIRKGLRAEAFTWEEAKQFTRRAEEILNENLLFRYPMLEGYGGLNRLLGKQEDNGFTTVRGKDGMLYAGNFWNGFGDDQKELAARTRRFFDALAQEGTKTGVVLYPMKRAQPENCYYGIPYNDYTALAEEMAAWLRYYDVPLLDLHNSETFYARMEGKQIFFKTDHHWTPEAALEGYFMMLDWLNEEFDAGLDSSGALRNLDSYCSETYPDYMFGSQGRKTGAVFAGGCEDYTFFYPKQEGDYILYRGDREKPTKTLGTFREALLFLDQNPESIYDGAAESVYLYSGVEPYVSIRNQEAKTDKRILLLRDSFATPVGAFLAQSFAEVDMLWTLTYDEERLAEFLNEKHYDYVLVTVYPENLQEQAFPFGYEEQK